MAKQFARSVYIWAWLGSITRVIGKLIQVDKGDVITARKSSMFRPGIRRLSLGRRLSVKSDEMCQDMRRLNTCACQSKQLKGSCIRV